MDANGQWLSIADAARTLSVSRQAIQGRMKRNTIEHRQDNRGNPLVRLPTSVPQAIPQVMVDTIATVPSPKPPSQTLTCAGSLEAVRAMLGEQRTHHDAAIAALRSDYEADLARIETRHAAELTRLHHLRRIDQNLTAMVAVLALTVIAVLGPVVLR